MRGTYIDWGRGWHPRQSQGEYGRVRFLWSFLLCFMLFIGLVPRGLLYAKSSNPYLLLVSFYSNELKEFSPEKGALLNHSPYNGVAIPLIGAYDAGQYTDKDFQPALNKLSKSIRPHVWPWIFWNRAIGLEPGKNAPHHNYRNNKAYFSRIKGIDLYNRSGALDDFYNLYRISLRSARKLGSPGIVVDLEPYNNHALYDIAVVAKKAGRSETEVRKRLNDIGATLADIAHEEYPAATVWFLLTGLTDREGQGSPVSDPGFTSIAYLVSGMLERTKATHSSLTIVEGGERSAGYCYASLDHMKKRLDSRDKAHERLLSRYPNLALGGTIAPWNATKKNWLLEGTCANSAVTTLRDFRPLFSHLFGKYKYVWIYAAEEASYDPYDPNLAEAYNQAIADAR